MTLKERLLKLHDRYTAAHDMAVGTLHLISDDVKESADAHEVMRLLDLPEFSPREDLALTAHLAQKYGADPRQLVEQWQEYLTLREEVLQELKALERAGVESIGAASGFVTGRYGMYDVTISIPDFDIRVFEQGDIEEVDEDDEILQLKAKINELLES